MTALPQEVKSNENSGPAVSLTGFEEFANHISALFEPSDRIEQRTVESWKDRDTGNTRSRVIYAPTAVFQSSTFARRTGPYRVLRALAEREHGNVYFGVCPREGYGWGWGHACMIRKVNVLWVDLDNITVEEALERCRPAGLPAPSIVVSSGNGVHSYWLLDTPYLINDAGPARQVYKDKAKWTDTNGKRRVEYVLAADGETRESLPDVSPQGRKVSEVLAGITRALGGDEHAVDLARLLRLPGFLNRKDGRNGTEPKPCISVLCERERRYSFDTFLPWRLEPPTPRQGAARENAQSNKVQQTRTPLTLGGPEMEKAREWLDNDAPICIDGSRSGSSTACKVARRLIHGFRLSEEQALSLMMGSEWNQKCLGPWDEDGPNGLARRVEWAAAHPYREDMPDLDLSSLVRKSKDQPTAPTEPPPTLIIGRPIADATAEPDEQRGQFASVAERVTDAVVTGALPLTPDQIERVLAHLAARYSTRQERLDRLAEGMRTGDREAVLRGVNVLDVLREQERRAAPHIVPYVSEEEACRREEEERRREELRAAADKVFGETEEIIRRAWLMKPPRRGNCGRGQTGLVAPENRNEGGRSIQTCCNCTLCAWCSTRKRAVAARHIIDAILTVPGPDGVPRRAPRKGKELPPETQALPLREGTVWHMVFDTRKELDNKLKAITERLARKLGIERPGYFWSKTANGFAMFTGVPVPGAQQLKPAEAAHYAAMTVFESECGPHAWSFGGAWKFRQKESKLETIPINVTKKEAVEVLGRRGADITFAGPSDCPSDLRVNFRWKWHRDTHWADIYLAELELAGEEWAAEWTAEEWEAWTEAFDAFLASRPPREEWADAMAVAASP